MQFRKPGKLRKRATTRLGCSFCGKPREKVRKIVAGPGVYICDECVALCVKIIEEEERV